MKVTDKLQDIIWAYADNQEKLALAKERIIPMSGEDDLIDFYENYERLNEELLTIRLENYNGGIKNN